MSRTLTLALLLAATSMSRADEPPSLVAPTGPLTPEEEVKAFRLPPGFEAQLVAAEPDIHKPMNLAFDARGRLWVTSSLEYPFPAKEGTTPRDAVKILSDFGPDGRARKVETFADGLNIPIGVLPLTPSEALVHSIPNVWRITDTDGDGKADRREPAYATYGFNDTHGMTNAFSVGFDGWVYACHGFANTSTVKGADGEAITMQSGNTYRMRPDGSHAEWFTHGQVNPFGIAFDPLGNLYTCDCHSRPIYQLLRGAYYPSFGKPHDGLGFGPEMLSHDHGSTGIAGIVYYAAEQFPAAYRGRILIGNVVTARINQDTLERHGSTYRAIAQPDFLASDDPWFRPVDIELGPDGTLYVADFYNKIIGHYEVPLTHPGRDRERGRIWRIVYKGDEAHAEPTAPIADLTTASVDQLLTGTGHANLAVRMRAADELVRRSVPAEVVRAALDRAEQPAIRRAQLLWVLQRLGALDLGRLRKGADDADPLVRVHAHRIVADRPTLPDAERRLALDGLHDSDAFVRRAAADALGRHPAVAQIRPLLELLPTIEPDDTHLRHVARMALRDQLAGATAWEYLEGQDWSERDARALADVALGVADPQAARFLLAHLRRLSESGETLREMVHHIARHGSEADREGLIAWARGDRTGDLGQQAALLRSIHLGLRERGAGFSPAALAWAADLVGAMLASDRAEVINDGLALSGELRLSEAKPAVLRLADDSKTEPVQRVAALRSLAAIDPETARPTMGRIVADAAAPLAVRAEAAGLLAQGNRPDARADLLAALPTAPAPLQVAIAVGLSGSKDGAEALLEAIGAGKASARLLQERPVEVKLKASGTRDVEARVGVLLAGLPAADAALEERIGQRRSAFARFEADPARGAAVFDKNCAACHQLAGRGAKVGPQLDGIGVRGAERLIEDILDPNRNIDQAFRVTTLALKNGQVVSGLLLREEGAVLVLADAKGQEVRVDAAEVDERHVAPLSPMPAGLADQVEEADFYHLLGYLLIRREPAAK